MTHNESLTVELFKELLKNHTHRFVEFDDGTGDKVCSICGKRLIQSRMNMKGDE
jgi:hypothetical protein